MAEVASIRAFVPVSQLAPEHYPRVNGANASEIIRRLQAFIGEKFTVTPITVEQESGKLILSEREAVSKRRSATLQKLSVGDVVTGTVSGIVNFGIFILFNDCLEGLVHQTEMSWEPVTDPAGLARLGEEKKVVVIGIEGDKISLSIRQTTPDPWKIKVADYSIGQTLTGTVVRVTPFGALVQMEDSITGLVPASQIQSEGRDEPLVAQNERVRVTLSTIDLEERRFGLSLVGSSADTRTKKQETDQSTTEAQPDQALTDQSATEAKPASKDKPVKAAANKDPTEDKTVSKEKTVKAATEDKTVSKEKTVKAATEDKTVSKEKTDQAES